MSIEEKKDGTVDIIDREKTLIGYNKFIQKTQNKSEYFKTREAVESFDDEKLEKFVRKFGFEPIYKIVHTTK